MEINEGDKVMKFEIDEYVVYGAAGICKLSGKEKRSFDGVKENEYYKLIPIQSINSIYYIPIDTINTKVRKLLTKDEIYMLIDNMPNIEPNWCSDNNERKVIFNSVLKSDDYEKIICMIKSLYLQKQKQISLGKKLLASDEIILNTAENMMHQEFAAVLGITPEKVNEFIIDRIEK